jgi:ribosomal protein S18 acetylase RimI-like enzyme
VVLLEELQVLSARARQAWWDGGWKALVGRSAHYVSRRVGSLGLRKNEYRLAEIRLDSIDIPSVTCPLEGLRVFRVTRTAQLDELVARGCADPRRHVAGVERLLRAGAWAYVAYVGSRIAHVSWVALTCRSKQALDSLPYSVREPGKEAVLSRMLTMREYRRMGVGTYVAVWLLKDLRKEGVVTILGAVERRNTASWALWERIGSKELMTIRVLGLFGRALLSGSSVAWYATGASPMAVDAHSEKAQE